jgi:hypothetical protein
VIDENINVVSYSRKTVQTVLTEIAGLLVLTRILQFFLVTFHEWRFNRKMIGETGEEFRECSRTLISRGGWWKTKR